MQAVNSHGFGFPFPSNGKAYHKLSPGILGCDLDNVSIPFKRESVSQVTNYQPPEWSLHGFNSLQTGKRITSY